jgi:D-alanine-D-alanine ligase-like ATP-grasp enzyme
MAVVGRKLLESYEGKGIIMFDPEKGSPTKEDVLACKVFTKFIPKDREFRVHVFKGKPLVILEKKKKKDWDGPTSKYIFNTENGYVFCQHDLDIAQSLNNAIQILAQQSSGVNNSDFQGVDIGYCSKKNNLFVIEVNSAPGIEGSNVGRYCDAIQAHLETLKPKKPAWPL